MMAATPCQTCQMKQSCFVKWNCGVSSVPTKRIDLLTFAYEYPTHILWALQALHLNQNSKVTNKKVECFSVTPALSAQVRVRMMGDAEIWREVSAHDHISLTFDLSLYQLALA
jgi:hypothetical protein